MHESFHDLAYFTPNLSQLNPNFTPNLSQPKPKLHSRVTKERNSTGRPWESRHLAAAKMPSFAIT